MPTTGFKDIATLMLGPLEGRGDDAWFHAPPGAWCPGQVVDHVAAAIELSARGFESRTGKPPMQRRPRTLRQRTFQFLIFRTGRFPRGRRAPQASQPADRPERAATERRLGEAVAAFLVLERTLLPQRAGDLFLKHPAFGDLTLSEWMTFHVRHAEHHAKQVRARIP